MSIELSDGYEIIDPVELNLPDDDEDITLGGKKAVYVTVIIELDEDMKTILYYGFINHKDSLIIIVAS